VITEARILRLGLGPRRRCGRWSCRCGTGRTGGIGGEYAKQSQFAGAGPPAGVLGPAAPNKANLPGRDGSAEQPCQREQKTGPRQTNPISGFLALKTGMERRNEANSPGWGGSAVRPCRRGRKTGLRQTKPISGFLAPKMRIGRKNEANSPGRGGLAVRRGRKTGLRQTKPIRPGPRGPRETRSTKLEIRNKLERQMIQTHGKRRTKPIATGECAKQSQFAGGEMEANCLFGKEVWGKRADCGPWKTKPICGAGVVRRYAHVDGNSGPGRAKRSQFAGPGRRASMAGAVACVLGNVGPPTPGEAGLRGSWRPGRRRGSWDRG